MGITAIFIDILYFSRLAIQSLGLITQTIVKRRRAKSTFKKALIIQGLPPKIAKEITEAYPNPITEIFSLVKNNVHSL
jgi:hypothetical protein